MQKFLLKTFVALFLAGAIFWMLLVISTTLLPKGNPIANFLTTTLNLPSDFQAKPKIVKEVVTFDDLMYSDYFYNFYAFSTVVLVAGLFTLTKGRNIVEKYMLLQAYALPREREYWGKITDRKHKPIPFASVRLFGIKDGTETFITQVVADLDGRYRLYLNDSDLYDRYFIEVKSTGYKDERKPFRKIFVENNNAIRLNVALTKLDEDIRVNPVRLFFAKHRSRILQVLSSYIFILALTTFLHAIYSIIYHPNFISLGDLIFYGFAAPWNVFVLLERRKFNPGQFIDTISKKPVANVNVKVFLPDAKVITLLSDEDGIVKFDHEPGKYNIKAYKPGFEGESTSNIPVEFNNEGYLVKNIYLKPVGSTASINSNLKFENPFGNRTN